MVPITILIVVCLNDRQLVSMYFNTVRVVTSGLDRVTYISPDTGLLETLNDRGFQISRQLA